MMNYFGVVFDRSEKVRTIWWHKAIFTNENLNVMSTFDHAIVDHKIRFFQCTEDEVERLLRELSPSIFPCLNGIHKCFGMVS